MARPWLCVGVLLASCATAPTTMPWPAAPPLEISGAARRAYLGLQDGSVYSVSDGLPPGLYVEGVMESGHFVPQGDVQGDGPLGVEGAPGWFEIPEAAFCSADSGRAPSAPYVEGVMSTEGIFVPSTRHVVY